MTNILENKVKGNLFKGVTNKEFCDKVLSYFVPTFNKPIQYENNTWGAYFHAYIGKDNLSVIKLFNGSGGKFHVIVSDKGRKFKTELQPQMIDYIINQITNL